MAHVLCYISWCGMTHVFIVCFLKCGLLVSDLLERTYLEVLGQIIL